MDRDIWKIAILAKNYDITVYGFLGLCWILPDSILNAEFNAEFGQNQLNHVSAIFLFVINCNIF